MPAIKNIESGEVTKTSEKPVWRSGVWFAGSHEFMDREGDQYVDASFDEINTTRFKLLWTIMEMIKIDELTATDKIVAKFLELVNDPKAPTVDLALASVQHGVGYVLSKIYPDEDDAEIKAMRLTEILSNKMN
jgi:hypothetical protein